MGVQAVQLQIHNGIIAHRGASAYAPENTLAAFDKALALGSNFLEFDVMLSADGEPFIFHDDSLKRTTNGVGEFGLVDSTYLKTLDAGKWFSRHYTGEKIPHLKEVIQWLTFTDVNANIEVKPFPGTTEQTMVAVMTYLNRYWPQSKALPLISSFDRKALTLCRSIAPEMPLGLLIDEWDPHWLLRANELQCYSVHLNQNLLNAARVQEIKTNGFDLYAYTVNRKRLARKLLDWGVDAIFSDYPDLLA